MVESKCEWQTTQRKVRFHNDNNRDILKERLYLHSTAERRDRDRGNGLSWGRLNENCLNFNWRIQYEQLPIFKNKPLLLTPSPSTTTATAAAANKIWMDLIWSGGKKKLYSKQSQLFDLPNFTLEIHCLVWQHFEILIGKHRKTADEW